MQMIIRHVAVLIAIALWAPYAFAGTIVKPYTFTNGATADANQVNADFDTLYNQTNKNTANITSLSTNLANTIKQINTRLVTVGSPYYSGSSFVSDVVSASCGAGEIIVGGTCSCGHSLYNSSTTNWGTVRFCDIAGNSVLGACIADYGIYSVSKLGPPVTAYAICQSVVKSPATALQKAVASTAEDALDPFKAERDSAIEKILQQQQEYIQQRQNK